MCVAIHVVASPFTQIHEQALRSHNSTELTSMYVCVSDLSRREGGTIFRFKLSQDRAGPDPDETVPLEETDRVQVRTVPVRRV